MAQNREDYEDYARRRISADESAHYHYAYLRHLASPIGTSASVGKMTHQTGCANQTRGAVT